MSSPGCDYPSPSEFACAILAGPAASRPNPAPTPLVLPHFGEIEPERILGADDLFGVITDKFPISPGHTLIVARRPVRLFQELTPAEKLALLDWVAWTQRHLTTSLTPAPDAFNLGLNDGPAAGQTMPQLHFHVIPRYAGDLPDPRGGLRWIIPHKARYW